jgi:hypothetical protein
VALVSNDGKYFKFFVAIKTSCDYHPHREWCKETFGREFEKWYWMHKHHHSMFFFTETAYKDWFIMRWTDDIAWDEKNR